MDYVSGSKSPPISLAVENISSSSDIRTGNDSEWEVVLALSRDAHLALIDTSTRNMINSKAFGPKENSTALSLHLLGKHIYISFLLTALLICSYLICSAQFFQAQETSILSLMQQEIMQKIVIRIKIQKRKSHPEFFYVVRKFCTCTI